MKRSILRLEAANPDETAFRTTFKTRHGRSVFLSLEIRGPDCAIADCFYTDRNQGRTGEARYGARPRMLRTLTFSTEDLLSVIETELDKRFYGVEFVPSEQAGLSTDEYLQFQVRNAPQKYCFLILVGEGESYNGLPVRLRTRLKTNLHRSAFIELAGQGVVKECYYYDRQYRRRDVKITPPQLIRCFFPYTESGILDLLNHEMCCDFTHIIVTDGIDVDSNTAPLCGAI